MKKTAAQLFREYRAAAPEDRADARVAWAQAEREQQSVERAERKAYEDGEQKQ